MFPIHAVLVLAVRDTRLHMLLMVTHQSIGVCLLLDRNIVFGSLRVCPVICFVRIRGVLIVVARLRSWGRSVLDEEG